MKKLITVALIFCAASLYPQELKTRLENAYLAFFNAVKTKDAEKFKKTISSYAYMNIKNQMLSAGMKFPDDFFGAAEQMQSDFKKLKYINAVRKGPTASGMYWGKDESGEIILYIFKFIEENGEWKFNMAEQKGSDEISKNIHAGNFAFLKDEKYQPDGVVPQTPKEITPGDYKAVLDISSSGYKLEVSVNGMLQKTISEGSSSGSILGGIKKGTNTVEIKVLEKKKDSMFPVTVGIRALINGEEKEVFLFKEKQPATVTKEFVVQ